MVLVTLQPLQYISRNLSEEDDYDNYYYYNRKTIY